MIRSAYGRRKRNHTRRITMNVIYDFAVIFPREITSVACVPFLLSFRLNASKVWVFRIFK